MATAFAAPPRDTMTAHGPTSPAFIKPEPDEIFGTHKFNNKEEPHFHNGNNYGPWQSSNINPSDISINGHNTGLSQHLTSSSPHLHNNFMMNQNTSAFTNDDLSYGMQGDQQGQQQQQGHFPVMNSFQNAFPQTFSPYSSTPDGQPMHSPFNNPPFDFSQYQLQTQQHRMSQQSVPTQMSRSRSGHSMQDPAHNMSPMSTNGLPIAHHMQHAQPINNHGHQRTQSNQWDNSVGSGFSPTLDSPMGSPPSGAVHQISEILGKTGASAPTRVTGRSTASAEQKKAKRRASHNEVERRRRNHINERITELAHLVPAHRLEDDAVRRSVSTSAAMPSLLHGGFSPPGTSSMAGSHSRRAGSVSQGPLGDDKDKGPAKGEVLDGAVSWTRDLLWLVKNLLEREEQLHAKINSLNGPALNSFSESELRMLSEVKTAIANNADDIRDYSRRHGSELFVPDFTDRTGARTAKESGSPDFDHHQLGGLDPGTSGDFTGIFKAEDDFVGDMELNDAM